jgi:outer membrane protein TolC
MPAMNILLQAIKLRLKLNLYKTLSITVLLFFSSCLYAQQAGHEPLEKSSSITFEEIFSHALNNAPETLERSVRQQQAASYEAIENNWISDRPSLLINYLDDALFDDIGQREFEYAVQLQLKRPSEFNNGRLLSESYQQQTSAWEQALRHYIAGRVRTSLADIAEADTRLALEHQATLNTESLLEITTTLFNAGELARLDVMQAENLLLAQRQTELETEALLVDAERAYEVLTGLHIRPDYTYRETLTDQEDVLATHPRLVYLQSDINLADVNILISEANARGAPTVSLGAARQRGSFAQAGNNNLTLSLSIPFGAKNIVASKTSTARREKVDAEVLYQNTHRNLDLALLEVEHELFLTNEAIVMAEERSQLSEQRWQMSRTAFSQGEITLAQVIPSLQAYLSAQKEQQLLLLKKERLITEYNQTIGVMP